MIKTTDKLLHELALPNSLAIFPELFACCAVLGNLLNISEPILSAQRGG
jgi:hypothetical protein